MAGHRQPQANDLRFFIDAGENAQAAQEQYVSF
jgi:hypothetical protein